MSHPGGERPSSLTFSTSTLIAQVAGAVVGAALLAALGVAVGSLVRSQLATEFGGFVWAIIIESIIGGLYAYVRPYLPYTAATTLAGAKLGDAAFGPTHGLNDGGPLPFAAAAALGWRRVGRLSSASGAPVRASPRARCNWRLLRCIRSLRCIMAGVAENGIMSDLPRYAVTRSARLARLPVGYAGRTALGTGRRLGGRAG